MRRMEWPKDPQGVRRRWWWWCGRRHGAHATLGSAAGVVAWKTRRSYESANAHGRPALTTPHREVGAEDISSHKGVGTHPADLVEYGAEQRPGRHNSPRPPTVAATAVVGLLSISYLLFVIHFSVNGLQLDDWGFVHLIHAEEHGHLTLTDLWTQHNENRMFIPNAITLTLGVATHDNTRTVMIISAVLFIASFLLFLLVLTSYLGRRLTAITVASTGVLWFSLADWQNALWGFQFAWYLVIFLLMAMLCLLRIRHSPHWITTRFVLALGVAVVASYTSAQGEFLWPIGALCLWWTLRGHPRDWPRRARVELVVWILVATLTTFGYFVGLTSSGQADPLTTLHYPLPVLQSVFANIGGVIPTSAPDLALHQLIGGFLLIAAAFVLVQSFRHRNEYSNPLPVSLIVFAVLFDPSVASIRLTFVFGITPSVAPRYTMANLFIPLAILVYALARHDAGASGTAHHSSRQIGVAQKLIVGGAACFLAIQVVSATGNGLSQARASQQAMRIGARLVVNRDRFPHAKQGCFDFAIVKYAGEVGDPQALVQAQEDRLSMFADGPYQIYRAEGLPRVC